MVTDKEGIAGGVDLIIMKERTINQTMMPGDNIKEGLFSKHVGKVSLHQLYLLDKQKNII